MTIQVVVWLLPYYYVHTTLYNQFRYLTILKWCWPTFFFLLFSYNWKFELLIWMTLISLLVERSKFGYRKLSYTCIVYILQLMQFCHNFYIVSRWKISPLHVYGHSHLHKLNAECAFIYICCADIIKVSQSKF